MTNFKRGEFADAGNCAYDGMFRALNVAIEQVCDQDEQAAISDAYRHLTGDCIPDECGFCEEEANASGD